ncbi:hypothetical protein [Sphingomonas sp. URHD0057]|uniref:hypothetical protein n=1 Tax=Sphingomonas sp. URHD0057 TaxID=1380389 RepID=UPI00048BB427|nr:hypothetical protein [Sphingomonas sp. URHD0057]
MNNDQTSKRWAAKVIHGKTYDLSHLNPFIMECPRAGDLPPHRIRVEFGVHTFAGNVLPHHTPDYFVMDGGNRRAFCHERYEHSLGLDQAVRAAVNGDVLLDKGRYNVCIPIDTKRHHLVAFKIKARPSRHYDVILTVVSAHVKHNANLDAPYASFKAVVGAAIDGRKINWKQIKK